METLTRTYQRVFRAMPGHYTTRRGNYESGDDYVLEYGELRFMFNEHDFRQRIEQVEGES